jgi:hypothetical protein
MTATIDAIPAGATRVENWRQSPNGHAVYRWFQGEGVTVCPHLTVTTGGVQILEDGTATVVRTIGVQQGHPDVLAHLSRENATRLAERLLEAVVEVSDLEAAEQTR